MRDFVIILHLNVYLHLSLFSLNNFEPIGTGGFICSLTDTRESNHKKLQGNSFCCFFIFQGMCVFEKKSFLEKWKCFWILTCLTIKRIVNESRSLFEGSSKLRQLLFVIYLVHVGQSRGPLALCWLGDQGMEQILSPVLGLNMLLL